MSTKYYAHHEDEVGMLVLGMLDKLECSVEKLTGPDPAPVRDGVLLVSCRSDISRFPNRFLRAVKRNMETEVTNRGFVIPR